MDNKLWTHPSNGCGCCAVFCFVLFAAFIIGMGLVFRSMDNENESIDHIKTQVYSPDGRYIAAVILREDSGLHPAEGGAERVCLRRSEDTFTFDAQNHIQQTTVFYDASAYGLEVKWQSNNIMNVSATCFSPSKAREQEATMWNDVKIIYHQCGYD